MRVGAGSGGGDSGLERVVLTADGASPGVGGADAVEGGAEVSAGLIHHRMSVAQVVNDRAQLLQRSSSLMRFPSGASE